LPEVYSLQKNWFHSRFEKSQPRKIMTTKKFKLLKSSKSPSETFLDVFCHICFTIQGSEVKEIFGGEVNFLSKREKSKKNFLFKNLARKNFLPNIISKHKN